MDYGFLIAQARPGDHLCWIYQTEQEHETVVVAFLREGLQRGEKLVYIADGHRAKVILDYLRRDGLDADELVRSGRLSLLTAEEAYLLGGVFSPDRMIELLRAETEAALRQGYTALRVTGETTWVLRGLPGSERLIEYEAKLNGFFPGCRCLGLCAYDRRRFEAALLLDVLMTHPVVMIGTEAFDNLYYVPPEQFLQGDRAAALDWWIHILRVRQRGEELRAMLASSLDGLCITDASGRLVEVNEAYCRMVGYSRDELLSMQVSDLEVAESPEEVRRRLAQMRRGRNVRFETRHRRKDGTIIDVDVSVSCVEAAQTRMYAFLRDITERKRAEQALRESKAALQRSSEQLRALAASLLAAQEEERRRLSRELHDDLNQKLAMLAVEAEALQQEQPLTHHAVRSRLGKLRDGVNALSDDISRIAYQLHPSVLDHLGLAVALRSCCREYSVRHGIRVTFTARGLPEAIPPEASLCLYRAAQEALRNVVKHARSPRVTVGLTGSRQGLHLSIADFGVGFEPGAEASHGGLGLVSMAERVRLAGGSLAVRSQPGRGTRLDLRIPVPVEAS